MNKIKLQELIREIVDEVLNEATIDVPNPSMLNVTQKQDLIRKARASTKNQNLGTANEPVEFVEESELDEMANIGVRYELAPDAAAADFTGKKARIITAMQATEEPMSKIEVATAMGYNKQNPINDDFMALVASGTIIPSGEQRAPRMLRPATEPVAGEEAGTEEEDELAKMGIVPGELSDEEIEASFAKAKTVGEEEPTAEPGEIAIPTSAGEMSDEDYANFMKYTDLMDRLNKVKSDLNKIKRSRFVAGGDIKDKPSNEEERLRTLKNSLEQRVNDLVASSEYLQKRQTKKTELDEWTKNKMQYYAGIIK